MKKIIVVISLALCCLMLCSVHTFSKESNASETTTEPIIETTTEATSEIEIEKGICGVNLTWSLDYTSGELTISGTGDMYDYDINRAPWYANAVITVNITDGVTSIGDSAFMRCRSLTSVMIPESVTSIGDLAFAWCSSLTSVDIPKNVAYIGALAFYGCESAEAVYVADNNNNFCSQDEVLFSKDMTVLKWYPAAKDDSSYTVPEGVTSIDEQAFFQCHLLSWVSIPEGITEIGYGTFFMCHSLISIELPDSLLSIGGYAFRDCCSLSFIDLPDSVTYIGSGAFENCISLTEITIPANISEINSSTFQGCRSLTAVSIPETAISIGDSAFGSCRLLSFVVIPESVVSIGASAFSGCLSLKDICINSPAAEMTESKIGLIYYDLAVDVSVKNYVEIENIIDFFEFNVITEEEAANRFNTIFGTELSTIDEIYDYYQSCRTRLDSPIVNELTTVHGIADSSSFYYCKSTGVKFVLSNGKCMHKNLISSATPTNCTVAGELFYCCLDCGETFNHTPQPLTEHVYDFWSVDVPATCCSKGQKSSVCSMCWHAVKTAEIDIDPNNHSGGTLVRNAKEASCLENGYSGDTYCLGCGAVIVQGSVINAPGHIDANNDGYCDECGELMCDCGCHTQSAITKFFWKIKVFFYKLFGIENRHYCKCGEAHW